MTSTDVSRACLYSTNYVVMHNMGDGPSAIAKATLKRKEGLCNASIVCLNLGFEKGSIQGLCHYVFVGWSNLQFMPVVILFAYVTYSALVSCFLLGC